MNLFRTLLGKANRVDSVPASPNQPERLAILSGETLLQPHKKTLVTIRQQVGIPDAHWAALYAPLFQQLAYFVQQLPASEAHHHRGVGGLLQHTLETTLVALTLRRGVLLPPNASAETLADKQDVWTYATGTAALLHDLGKPVADQQVTLYDNSRTLGHWNPLAGPMSPPATAYSISFVRGRRYRIHPRIPPLLVQYLVPPMGLSWITGDLDVFESWLATISGGDSEFAAEVGALVRQADGRSVAEDLSGGAPVAAAAAGAPPSFGERLAVTLRQLIDAQTLPLNRPGAAGFVIDDDLWLVSKRVLDELREAMRQSSSGIPTRNDRLMDELQQAGIVSANGERAIWNAAVEIGSWHQSLTLLRVPLGRLWLDPAARPPAIPGGRIVLEHDADATPVPQTQQLPAVQSPAVQRIEIKPNDLPVEGRVALSAFDIAVWPPGHDEVPTSGRVSESHSRIETPEVSPPPTGHHQISGDAGDPEQEPAPELDATKLRENDFVQWLVAGLGAGRIKINTPDARLHMTAEGLLLVSPGIFRDFAGTEGWSNAQKRLCKLKIHSRTAEQTNIWTYRVAGDRKSGALLKGILISDAENRFGMTLPAPNPHLTILTST